MAPLEEGEYAANLRARLQRIRHAPPRDEAELPPLIAKQQEWMGAFSRCAEFQGDH